MALILAAVYPDIFAAVGAHSALSVGSAHDASGNACHEARCAGQPVPRADAHDQFPWRRRQGVHVRSLRYVAARAADAYQELVSVERKGRMHDGHPFVHRSHRQGKGKSFTELWIFTGAGHAWSGGSQAGRFTDPAGPDASREMLHFILKHRTTLKQRKAAALASVA
jgi:poly(3-hydroxybutyrate) depolymerase